jgi:hypothetical protein
MSNRNRDIIFATVDDLVTDFLYYDRKEDEDLPVGSIQDAIHTSVISLDELVARFRENVEKGMRTP